MEADLEDERIAMLLQNEEFMAELRWNKDFLSALDDGKFSNQDICTYVYFFLYPSRVSHRCRELITLRPF